MKTSILLLCLIVLSSTVFGSTYLENTYFEDQASLKEQAVVPASEDTYGKIFVMNDRKLYYKDSLGASFDVLLGGNAALDSLLDVDVATPATGDLLVFDGTEWVDSTNIYLDSTGLGLGNATHDNALILDLTTTTKGSRPCPLMTEVQRDALVGPLPVGTCIINSTSVSYEFWDGATFVALGAGGMAPWATASNYEIDDVVHVNNLIYKSITNHVSGVFATDLGNGDWVEISALNFNSPVTGVNLLTNGGTSKSLTASNGGMVYSDADSFEIGSVGTSGQALLSGAAGAYSWFNPAQFSFIMGGASGALTALGPLTDGQLLIGSTGVAPAASSLTGTANQITVTPGAGSITLSLPQSIATTDNVTFGSVKDSSLTAGRNTFAGTAGDLSDDGDWLFNTAGNVVTLTSGQMNVDSLRLDGDTLSNQGSAGDVVIQADPAGVGGRAKFTNGTSSEYYIGSNNPELKQMMLYPSFEESVAELQCDFCSGFTQQTSTGVEGELYGLFYARASYAGAATDTIYVMPGTNFDDDMPASVSCWINTARAGVTFRFSNTFDGDSDSQVVSSGGTWAKYTAQGTCRAGIGEGCGWKIVDNTSEAGVVDINGCSIELGNSGLALTSSGVSGILPMSKGGTNKAMTAVNGGIVYSDADSQEVTSAQTAGRIVLWGGAGAPTAYAPTADRVLFAGTSGVAADDAGMTYTATTDTLNVGNVSVTSTTEATRNMGNIPTASQPSAAANTDKCYMDTSIHAMLCSDGVNWNLQGIGVDQAKVFGSILWVPTTANFWTRTSGAFGSYSANAAIAAPTVTGNATAPGTRIPALVFASMPVGDYEITVNGGALTGAGSYCAYRVTDGTNNTAQSEVVANAGASISSGNMSTRLSYTTAQTNVTLQIQGKGNNGSYTCDIGKNVGDTQSLEIIVKYFPPLSATYSVPSPDFDLIDGGAMTIGATTTPPTKGTIVTDRVLYSRKGQRLLADYQFSQSAAGTSGTGDYLFTLPAGLSFDSTKVNFYTGTFFSATTANESAKAFVGTGSVGQSLSNGYIGLTKLYAYDATRFRVVSNYSNGAGTGEGGPTVMGSTTVGDLSLGPTGFGFKIDVPISGWTGQHLITATLRDAVKTVGTPNGQPKFYSAKVSGAGVVTGEVGDFIDGNCAVAASIATCTWTVGAFTTVANCVAMNTINTSRFMTADATTTTVSGTFKGWSDGGGAGLNDFTLLCHGY